MSPVNTILLDRVPKAVIGAAAAKWCFVPQLTSSYTTQRTAARLYVPLLFLKTPKYARSVQLDQLNCEKISRGDVWANFE